MKQLTAYDFIALLAIEAEPGISVRTLHSKINAIIDEYHMPGDYAVEKQSKYSVERCLLRLRETGLVKAQTTEINPEGVRLLERITRQWKRWPFYIPIEGSKILFDQMKERH